MGPKRKRPEDAIATSPPARKRPRQEPDFSDTTGPTGPSYDDLLQRLGDAPEPDQKDEKYDEEDDDEDHQDGEEDADVDMGDEKVEEKASGGRFWVYLLESCASPHYSYVGFTVNRERRLRQHNGELACGGAKYTKLHRPWRMVLSMTGSSEDSADDWWTKNAALQLEWRVKHVSKGFTRRRRPKMGNLQRQRWKTLRFHNRPAVERRVNDILWLLHNRRKWTSNSPEWKPGRKILIEMQPHLASKEVTDFLQQCSFWQPTIQPLPSPLPKLQNH